MTRFLQARNVADKDVYYHGLIRFFRHHFPNTNPCYPMVALGNLCLLTRSPGHFFRYVFEQHQQNGVPSAPDQWLDLRRRYGELGYVRKEWTSLVLGSTSSSTNRERVRQCTDSSMERDGEHMRTGMRCSGSQPELCASLIPLDELLLTSPKRWVFPHYSRGTLILGSGCGHADLRSFCFLGHAAFELIDGL